MATVADDQAVGVLIVAKNAEDKAVDAMTNVLHAAEDKAVAGLVTEAKASDDNAVPDLVTAAKTSDDKAVAGLADAKNADGSQDKRRRSVDTLVDAETVGTLADAETADDTAVGNLVGAKTVDDNAAVGRATEAKAAISLSSDEVPVSGAVRNGDKLPRARLRAGEPRWSRSSARIL
jgi:hypothetical protein